MKKINTESKQYKKMEKQVDAYNTCLWNQMKPDTQRYDEAKIIMMHDEKGKFVLDTSSDMHEEGFRNAQQFIKNAIKSSDKCSQSMNLKSMRNK